jgi:DNA-binding LacI/PurR family transcriptional regulator
MTVVSTSNLRSTYAEIAARAGVSKATVSRVMNGDDRVHPERANAVMQAADKLGYKPNRAARALSTGKTGLVAVVIDDEPAALSDPFWGVVLAGISRVFMSNDLHSLLMVSPLDSTDGPIAHYLEGGEVDGAIFLQVHKDAVVESLRAKGLPVVLIGRPVDEESKIPFVDSDNLGGALTATRHLFSRGCKQVATLTGDVEASAGIDRLKGYRAAHLEAGREINEDLIANCDWTFESAKTMTLRLLARNPEVDGIFAANDIMALGAIAAIQERGRLVPDDIAVVGFDDNIVAQTHRPGLTTIRQDIVGLGAAAAETMISVLQNREPNIQMLPTEIIIRESA